MDTSKKQRKSFRLTDRYGVNRELARNHKSQNDGEFKRPNPIDDDCSKFMKHLPPPLPPKPKNLTNDYQMTKKVENKIKNPVYLDKPASSFV